MVCCFWFASADASPKADTVAIGEGKIAPTKWGDKTWIAASSLFANGLLAAELGIPLNEVPIDLRIGKTRTSEYLAMNPNGRIPTLKDDGFVLWESPAILKYLSAKRPDRGLCGGDPKTQARE
jgi:glutathione S-transferase